MNPLVFSILASVTAAFAVWGLSRLIIELANQDRRKLQQRLVGVTGQKSFSAQRPLLLQMTPEGLSGMLVRVSLLDRLQRELTYAFPSATVAGFLTLALSLAITLFVLCGLFADSLMIGMLAGALGGGLPLLVVHTRRSRRQRMLAEQLPDALDFLSRILRAGHSLNTGIQMMGHELPEPLAGEFRRCHDQLSLGSIVDDAMKEMANRVAAGDFAFFVTAVLIQRQTGGDLGEVLGNTSHMIRQRLRLQRHVKAITSEGRLTGNILVAFPALLFVITYILNPAYAGIMTNSSEGRLMLGGTFLLQILGLLTIRKIVRVKV